MATIEVIKYEGDNTTFIWKHPTSEFNSTTQLIVHETQEAIFFMNGQALDLFGPGRHTLETQNIPLIRKILSLPTGKKTPFKCEVYFINKTEQMAIKWGTDSKVQYMESTYKFPLSIGASGEMSLRVEDSRKLLLKLVGTENSLGQTKLASYFRSFLMTKVKTYIAQAMRENVISIFEIDENLDMFSNNIKNKLISDFSDYGISLERFFVMTVVKPEGDPIYEKFKQLHFRQYADVAEAELRQKVGIIDQTTEAQKTIIEAQGIGQKRQIEGYTYQQERGFDVSEKIAQNEGAGNFSSAGIGLGMMTGIGGPIGGVVSDVFKNAVSPISGKNNETQSAEPKHELNEFCDECGTKITEGVMFCDECGKSVKKPLAGCMKCDFTFEKPSKFCPRCGTKREVSHGKE